MVKKRAGEAAPTEETTGDAADTVPAMRSPPPPAVTVAMLSKAEQSRVEYRGVKSELLGLGDIYLNDLSDIFVFEVTNQKTRTLKLQLRAELRKPFQSSQWGFQLENENITIMQRELQQEKDRAVAVDEFNHVPFSVVRSSSKAALCAENVYLCEGYNELFNHIGTVDEIVLSPKETKRIMFSMCTKLTPQHNPASSSAYVAAGDSSEEERAHLSETSCFVLSGRLILQPSLVDGSVSSRLPIPEMLVPLQGQVCRSLLRLDVKELHFDDCVPGGSFVKDFTVWNRSEIPLLFKLVSPMTPWSENKELLVCTDYNSGYVIGDKTLQAAAYGHVRIRVTYRPTDIGDRFFEIQAQNLHDSRNVKTLRIHAITNQEHHREGLSIKEPNGSFLMSGSRLDFGDCYTGIASSKVILMRNMTEVAVHVDLTSDRPKEVTFELKLQQNPLRVSRAPRADDLLSPTNSNDGSSLKGSLSPDGAKPLSFSNMDAYGLDSDEEVDDNEGDFYEEDYQQTKRNSFEENAMGDGDDLDDDFEFDREPRALPRSPIGSPKMRGARGNGDLRKKAFRTKGKKSVKVPSRVRGLAYDSGVDSPRSSPERNMRVDVQKRHATPTDDNNASNFLVETIDLPPGVERTILIWYSPASSSNLEGLYGENSDAVDLKAARLTKQTFRVSFRCFLMQENRGSPPQVIVDDRRHLDGSTPSSSLAPGSTYADGNFSEEVTSVLQLFAKSRADCDAYCHSSLPTKEKEEEIVAMVRERTKRLQALFSEKKLVLLSSNKERNLRIPAKSRQRIVAVFNPVASETAAKDFAKTRVEKHKIMITLPPGGNKKAVTDGSKFDQGKPVWTGSKHPFDTRPSVRELLLKSRVCRSVMNVNQKNINFGRIATSAKSSKRLVVQNMSATPLVYSVEKTGSISSGFLQIKEGEVGVVKAFGTKEICFQFQPTLAGPFEEKLKIINVQDTENSVSVTIKAKIVKRETFKLLQSGQTISFGKCLVGEKTEEVKIAVRNTSRKKREYVIQVDPSFTVPSMRPTFYFSVDETPATVITQAQEKKLDEELEKLEHKLRIAVTKKKADKIVKLNAKISQVKALLSGEQVPKEPGTPADSDAEAAGMSGGSSEVGEFDPYDSANSESEFSETEFSSHSRRRRSRQSDKLIIDAKTGLVSASTNTLHFSLGAEATGRVVAYAIFNPLKSGDTSPRAGDAAEKSGAFQSQKMKKRQLRRDATPIVGVGKFLLFEQQNKDVVKELQYNADIFLRTPAGERSRDQISASSASPSVVGGDITFENATGTVEAGSFVAAAFVYRGSIPGQHHEQIVLRNLSGDRLDTSVLTLSVRVTRPVYVRIPELDPQSTGQLEVLNLGPCYVTPEMQDTAADSPNVSLRFSKVHKLTLQSQVDHTLVVFASSNLKTQCYVYEDGHLHREATHVVLKGMQSIDLYVAIRPRLSSEAIKTGSTRDLVGGIRVQLFGLHTTLDATGEEKSEMLAEFTVKFVGVAGASIARVTPSLIDFGVEYNSGRMQTCQTHEGRFELMNMSKALPLGYRLFVTSATDGYSDDDDSLHISLKHEKGEIPPVSFVIANLPTCIIVHNVRDASRMLFYDGLDRESGLHVPSLRMMALQAEKTLNSDKTPQWSAWKLQPRTSCVLEMELVRTKEFLAAGAHEFPLRFFNLCNPHNHEDVLVRAQIISSYAELVVDPESSDYGKDAAEPKACHVAFLPPVTVPTSQEAPPHRASFWFSLRNVYDEELCVRLSSQTHSPFDRTLELLLMLRSANTPLSSIIIAPGESVDIRVVCHVLPSARLPADTWSTGSSGASSEILDLGRVWLDINIQNMEDAAQREEVHVKGKLLPGKTFLLSASSLHFFATATEMPADISADRLLPPLKSKPGASRESSQLTVPGSQHAAPSVVHQLRNSYESFWVRNPSTLEVLNFVISPVSMFQSGLCLIEGATESNMCAMSEWIQAIAVPSSGTIAPGESVKITVHLEEAASAPSGMIPFREGSDNSPTGKIATLHKMRHHPTWRSNSWDADGPEKATDESGQNHMFLSVRDADSSLDAGVSTAVDVLLVLQQQSSTSDSAKQGGVALDKTLITSAFEARNKRLALSRKLYPGPALETHLEDELFEQTESSGLDNFEEFDISSIRSGAVGRKNHLPVLTVRGCTPAEYSSLENTRYLIDVGQHTVRNGGEVEWEITIESLYSAASVADPGLDSVEYRLMLVDKNARSWLQLSRERGTLDRAHSYQSVVLYFLRGVVGVYSTFMVLQNMANPSDLKVIHIRLEVIADLNSLRGMSSGLDAATNLFRVLVSNHGNSKRSRRSSIEMPPEITPSGAQRLMIDFSEVYYYKLYQNHSIVIENSSGLSLDFILSTNARPQEVSFSVSPMSFNEVTTVTLGAHTSMQVFLHFRPQPKQLVLPSSEASDLEADIEVNDPWVREIEVYVSCRLVKDFRETVILRAICSQPQLMVSVANGETNESPLQRETYFSAQPTFLGLVFPMLESTLSNPDLSTTAADETEKYLVVRNTKSDSNARLALRNDSMFFSLVIDEGLTQPGVAKVDVLDHGVCAGRRSTLLVTIQPQSIAVFRVKPDVVALWKNHQLWDHSVKEHVTLYNIKQFAEHYQVTLCFTCSNVASFYIPPNISESYPVSALEDIVAKFLQNYEYTWKWLISYHEKALVPQAPIRHSAGQSPGSPAPKLAEILNDLENALDLASPLSPRNLTHAAMQTFEEAESVQATPSRDDLYQLVQSYRALYFDFYYITDELVWYGVRGNAVRHSLALADLAYGVVFNHEVFRSFVGDDRNGSDPVDVVAFPRLLLPWIRQLGHFVSFFPENQEAIQPLRQVYDQLRKFEAN
ncbi:uncharacterized protein KRP23_6087 [Phytophthora ramorum]|uniref:uncharacterized protein n=1 Tax=Phytophthora ramorum TaxID=164328 RepID=UPI0030AD213E|nr:hypothetical protein KRP23_6087 [Phytophthora ramorum]